jgi:hypothetical protein
MSPCTVMMSYAEHANYLWILKEFFCDHYFKVGVFDVEVQHLKHTLDDKLTRKGHEAHIHKNSLVSQI